MALFELGALSDLSPQCDLTKADIGEGDNSELDDVSVSLRAIWSDRLSDPRTVNRSMGDARAASWETTRFPLRR